MGADPYWYFEKYDSNIDAALQRLRNREFKAGRYYPVMDPVFPLTAASPAPGAQHATIDEAREAGMEEGTHCILDLDHVSDTPEWCAVSRLPDAELQRIFGTTKPTRADLECERKMSECFELIDRIMGIYIVYYNNGVPEGIYFAGYTAD